MKVLCWSGSHVSLVLGKLQTVGSAESHHWRLSASSLTCLWMLGKVEPGLWLSCFPSVLAEAQSPLELRS
jgi:hypothetical protein